MTLIDYVINSLEDNRSAVVLSAVDFSKAFNRLEHLACLKSFAKLGASTDIILLVAAFLHGRSMTVKVGSSWSDPKPVNEGAPRVSVLGCFLFNIGVDDLDEGPLPNVEPAAVREHMNRTDDFPALSTPTRVNTGLGQPGLSPISGNNTADFTLLPRIANIPPWLKKKTEKKLDGSPPT